MKLSEYLYSELARAGVCYAFGVPGYFVMPIWQRFTDAPRIVLSRHESGAVFMADGWSRTTRRLGVALATTGPGLTNCVTGVACAYRDSIPVLIITGQAPTKTFGRGAFLESYILDRSVGPAELLGPITKKSIEIVELDNARFLIDTALMLAVAGRPGPVHLSIPIDLQDQELPQSPGAVRSHRTRALQTDSTMPAVVAPMSGEDTFARACAALSSARRPLLIAGWGTYLADASKDLMRLAEKVGGVVVSTTKALACFSGQEPAFLGHLGPGQRPDIVEGLRGYVPDVVVVAGASLSQYYASGIWPLLEQAFVVRIDIDADQLGLRLVPDVALHGDARWWLAALRSSLGGASSRQRSGRSELVAAFRARHDRAATLQSRQFDGKPSMAGTIARLHDILPEDCVVIPDAGNHWLDTMALYRPSRPGGLQVNCGVGPMGWAIGAAVGAAFAHHDWKTVCVTGDGSMLMHGVELSVAAEHGLNLLAIVYNNRAHGRVRLGQRVDFDSDPLGTDIPPIDFAQWSSAMGITSFKVVDPNDFEPVVASALKCEGTTVVEVECHPDEVPASLRNWIADAE
ncbi:MAG: thiamine pyrophosphate-binding protein [Egibacteraceae bacterium]